MRRTIRLRTVLIVLSLLVLILPVAGIQVMRLYESALVRQTESSLIAQGVFIASFYRALFHQRESRSGPRSDDEDPALPLAEGLRVDSIRTWHLRPAQLDLADSSVLPPFPDGYDGGTADDTAMNVAAQLAPVLKDAQLETLAAIRIVDHKGVVVATTGESMGRNLAAGDEVRRALTGEYVSRLRRRLDVEPSALSSISRTSGVRVFVAVPIVIDNRVHGAVLLSRTPVSILQALYGKRFLLLKAAGVILAVVLAVALFASRLIARPLAQLADGAESIARGGANTLTDVPAPRTREIAQLQANVVAMAHSLEERAAYVSEFSRHVSHEFKTPLTAIAGAVEVLRDHGDDMTTNERRRFLDNIGADADRLHRLTQRLLELAKADMASFTTAPTDVVSLVQTATTQRRHETLCVEVDQPPKPVIALASAPVLQAVIDNLLDNSVEHGADAVRISFAESGGRAGGRADIYVTDDGPGISPANRERVFEPFFTTARERGGTGLGLTIARALLRRSGGDVTVTAAATGASFAISLPRPGFPPDGTVASRHLR